MRAGTGKNCLGKNTVNGNILQERRFTGCIGACHKNAPLCLNGIGYRFLYKRMIKILCQKTDMLSFFFAEAGTAPERKKLPKRSNGYDCIQFSHIVKKKHDLLCFSLYSFQSSVIDKYIHMKKHPDIIQKKLGRIS